MRHAQCLQAAIAVVLTISVAAVPARAQTNDPSAESAPQDPPHKKPAPKKPRDKYGSPLNTLMTTHLWTDVPQAEGFVRRTHPAAKDVDYTPLTGTDPDRPKPRDKANIMALQAELEQAGATAQAKGGGAKAARKKAKAAE